VVVRAALADEVVRYLEEEGGGSLKRPREAYIAMFAARCARYSEHEATAIGSRYERGRVLVTKLDAADGMSSRSPNPCYVVALTSAEPLSPAEGESLSQRAATELCVPSIPADRAVAALYGVVFILALVFFFW